MRAKIALVICVLVLSVSPSHADPLADVIARLDSLEKRNDQLAKENASLRQRVAKLEGGSEIAAAQVGTRDRHAPPTIVTTSAVVPTSARYETGSIAPTQAADRPFSWSGGYLGVHGGGAWSDVGFNEIIAPETFRNGLDGSGGIAGVQIGANKQFGNWVVGAELSVSGADVSGKTRPCLDDPVLPFDGEECSSRVNWLLTGLARLGYAHDRWLISGAAGWTVAGAEHEFVFDIGGQAATGFNETLDGFTYGAGFNYALTRSVSLGVEYLHADLSANGSGFLGNLFGVGTGHREVDLDIARAQLNVKLGD